MAGTKVNNYSNIDTNIQALQLTTDKVFKGLHQLTLTEMDTTTVPAIASGSVVECNGALIKYDAEEAIVTTDPHTLATVGDGGIYIVVKGSDCTAYFTATAPTWSDEKQGYYGLTTWANDRYVANCTKAGTSYTFKYIINNQKIQSAKSLIKITNSVDFYSPVANPWPLRFDTIIFNNKDELSSGGFSRYEKFTAKNAGYYNIYGFIIFLPRRGSADGYGRYLQLGKNGSLIQTYNYPPIVSVDFTTFYGIPFNDLIYLDANDYLILYIGFDTTPIPSPTLGSGSYWCINQL